MQKITTKQVASAISHGFLAILITTHAHAQNSPTVAFSLSGLAPYQKLRKEYYLGAHFLPTPRSDTVNFAGKKRMEMRVSIHKWTRRRFSHDWSQAIFLNNDQALVKQFADQIQTFANLPKDDLIAGDHIAVDMDPDQGTTVSLNGSKVFNVADNAFFDVLLNVWVGKRPPSSDFRHHILTFPAGQVGKDLLVRFQQTAPTRARRNEVADWFQPKSTH